MSVLFDGIPLRSHLSIFLLGLRSLPSTYYDCIFFSTLGTRQETFGGKVRSWYLIYLLQKYETQSRPRGSLNLERKEGLFDNRNWQLGKSIEIACTLS